MNLAVLLQLVGLIVTFVAGVPGYFIGPFMIIVGAVFYRQAKRQKKLEAEGAETASGARMGLAKKVAIAFGVVAIVVLGGIGAVYYFTSGMVNSVDGFFVAVKARDYDKAENYLAEEFRNETPRSKLEAFVAASGLSNYKSADWSSRTMTVGQGELIGNIVTVSGGVIPIRVRLISEHGAWKIYAIEKARAGADGNDGASAQHI